MQPLPDLAMLRRFADGRATPADHAVLAQRIRAYLMGAPEGVSLDAVFGVARPAGVMPWWRVEALAARDARLRALAATYYGDRTAARQAVEIRSALLSYAASAWRFDRRETRPPQRYSGTRHEMMFDTLSTYDVVPSERQIRRILRPCKLAIE